MQLLKDRFCILLNKYTNDQKIEQLWLEIEEAYSKKGRHYHNLNHLVTLFAELKTIKHLIMDWDTMSLSVFYHDIIYNVRKQDNEERSAELAQKRLREIGYPNGLIKKCVEQIIATKRHELSQDNDTNLFTDADLSILGKDEATYLAYYQNIRREYRIYPQLIYNPARKKALLHFLEMSNIFKTEYFRDKYQKVARRNIQLELDSF